MKKHVRIIVHEDFANLLDQARREMMIQTGKNHSMFTTTQKISRKKKLI